MPWIRWVTPLGVIPMSDDPLSWEDLAAAEEDLQQRVEAALAADLPAAAMRALADERDRLATERDTLSDASDVAARSRADLALQRDVSGSGRDRAAREHAHDRDAAAVDRFMAGSDRDLAAGDRADSHDDRAQGGVARRRAAEDRQQAAHDRQQAADDRDAAAAQAAAAQKEVASLHDAMSTRLVIGQAEGLLRARHNLDAEAAFALLVRLSQQTRLKLRVVAARIVRDHVESSKLQNA